MGVNVSVIGLGKLGCPLAACYASKGSTVVGVDMDSRAVESVNRGQATSYEPGLQEIMDGTFENLRATQDFTDAVESSDLTFVVVPTPSRGDGTFTNEYVIAACESIGQVIKTKDGYHMVVIVSTVMPGSTGGELREALELTSGKSCGVDFGLCYAPAFVALGSVVRDFLVPDYLLIGESDPQAGKTLEDFYGMICEGNPPVSRMNFVNAELTKLATNAFVSTKITFSNMMSQICEHVPDAHIDIVTSALGMDTRIGPKYLKGGLGYGGPCLDRDNVALASMAASIGAKAILAEATEHSNRQEVTRLVKLIKSKRNSSASIGVLGLSYKPNTNVIDASQGLLLAQALIQEGYQVVAHDPVAMEEARRVLGDSVLFAESADQCIQKSEVTVIATPWKCFEQLDPASFDTNDVPNHRKVLIDCWRMLDGAKFAPLAEYISLGVGPAS